MVAGGRVIKEGIEESGEMRREMIGRIYENKGRSRKGKEREE